MGQKKLLTAAELEFAKKKIEEETSKQAVAKFLSFRIGIEEVIVKEVWPKINVSVDSTNEEMATSRSKDKTGKKESRPRIYCNASCTLSPREPETRRERECRREHSPHLGSSRVASALGSRLLKVSLF